MMRTQTFSVKSNKILYLFFTILLIILSNSNPIFTQGSINDNVCTDYTFKVTDATEICMRLAISPTPIKNKTRVTLEINNLPTDGIDAASLKMTGPGDWNWEISSLTAGNHPPLSNSPGKNVNLQVTSSLIDITIDHSATGTNEEWFISLINLGTSGNTEGSLATENVDAGQFTDIYLKPEVNAGSDFTILEGASQTITASLVNPLRHFNIAAKTWDNGILYLWSSTDFNPQNSLVTTYTAPVSNITPYTYTLKATAGLLKASDELRIMVTTPTIKNIIDQALDTLANRRNSNGSWTNPRDGAENVGLTAMATWCFLKSGKDETNEIVQKAVKWIITQRNIGNNSISANISTRVYDTALAVLALIATNTNKDQNKYTSYIHNACSYLVSMQNDEEPRGTEPGYAPTESLYGGWGYGDYETRGYKHADLSNSQFVMLALHYAEAYHFFSIPSELNLWEKALIFVTRCQNRTKTNTTFCNGRDDGGFCYQPGYEYDCATGICSSNGSMTMAGLWGLACCLSEVDRTDEILGQANRAWDWVQEHYSVTKNPFYDTRTLYYYLFGMTRAALLWGKPSINGDDWKIKISEELIEAYKDKSWNILKKDWHETEQGIIGFCWALLALEDTQNPPSGSKLVIKVASPVDLHVYDQKNNHVGINYQTGMTEIQISGALYSGTGTHPQVVEIPDLESGTYTINLVGTGEGEFTLTIDGFLNEKNIFSDISTGRITSQEVFKAQATVSRIVGPLTIDTPPPNRVVSGLECSSVLEKIYLKWNSIENANGYKIYYDSDFAGLPYNGGVAGDSALEGKSPIDVGNNTTFQLTGLNAHKKYYITVTYYADSLESPFSHEVQCFPSGIYEAEAMENRKTWYGSPCPDGWRLTHQNQPVHQEIHILSPIDCYFTVHAKAEIAGHAAPWLGVALGDIFKGCCEVSSTEWKEYSFVIKNLSAGTYQLALSFLNDYWNKYQGDRNLLLDKIIIEQYSGQTIDSSHVFEAENMKESYIDNYQSGGFMVLHKPYSYLLHELFIEQPELTFILYAKGDSIKGGWPQMDFQLDGQTKASFLVNSDVPQQYSVQLRDITPGKHQLKLSYNYNSYTCQRKLYIDKMVIINNKGNLLKPKPAIEANENLNISLPETFKLEQNFPNPFNPDTQIKYQLPIDTHVTIHIFNMLGQDIKTLVDENKKAGFYTLNWNGRDNMGNSVSAGVYLYKIQAENYFNIKKLIILK